MMKFLKFDSATEPVLRDNAELRKKSLFPMVRQAVSQNSFSYQEITFANEAYALNFQDKVEMVLPIAIGDYSDFFSSMHHAKNCGTIFRGPENPIPQNWYVRSIWIGSLFQFPTQPQQKWGKTMLVFTRFQVPSSHCLSWTGIIYCYLRNKYHSAKVLN